MDYLDDETEVNNYTLVNEVEVENHTNEDENEFQNRTLEDEIKVEERNELDENTSQYNGGNAELVNVEGEKHVVGMEFKSEDDAYHFYNAYAKVKGFSIRKHWVRRSRKSKLIVAHTIVCSSEGYKYFRRRMKEE
jgi:zinc finger SWIM domain-containing protein 3